MKAQPLTICKLHCGCSGVRCLCSFLDRHVLRTLTLFEIRNDNLQFTVNGKFEKNKLVVI